MSEDNGSIEHLTLEILRSIRDEIVTLRIDTNERFESMDKRLERLVEASVRGFTEVNERLTEVNERLDAGNRRLDNILEFAGERYREHGQRIAALESRVDQLDEGVR